MQKAKRLLDTENNNLHRLVKAYKSGNRYPRGRAFINLLGIEAQAASSTVLARPIFEASDYSRWYSLVKNKIYPCAVNELYFYWQLLFRKHNYDNQWRIVDTVGDYRISTVFLFLDHSLSKGNEPTLFETLVFKGDGVNDTVNGARYCTWKEARQNHRQMVSEYGGENEKN